jgi:hypothetical protein
MTAPVARQQTRCFVAKDAKKKSFDYAKKSVAICFAPR